MKNNIPILCILLIGVLIGKALAETAGQDLISFLYRPSGGNWQTTNCLSLCKVMYSQCAIDCTELIRITADFKNQMNTTEEADYWFNQTNNENVESIQ